MLIELIFSVNFLSNNRSFLLRIHKICNMITEFSENIAFGNECEYEMLIIYYVVYLFAYLIFSPEGMAISTQQSKYEKIPKF